MKQAAIVVVLAAIAYWCFWGDECGKDEGKQQTATTSTVASTPEHPKEPAPPAPEPDLPFVAERKEYCQRYKSAPNEIKGSAVATDYLKVAKNGGYMFKEVPGTIRKIKTTMGGDEVLLTVVTPFGKVFNNTIAQEIPLKRRKYEIRKGSNLYKKLGDLTESARVRVSAEGVVPFKNVMSEKATVCGNQWVVKFTDVEAVK